MASEFQKLADEMTNGDWEKKVVKKSKELMKAVEMGSDKRKERIEVMSVPFEWLEKA